jgi:hypothetical protein
LGAINISNSSALHVQLAQNYIETQNSFYWLCVNITIVDSVMLHFPVEYIAVKWYVKFVNSSYISNCSTLSFLS